MKTVINAVNELMADISNSFCYRDDQICFIFHDDSKRDNWIGFEFKSDCTNTDYKFAFTIEEFNQCVDEMATNYGRSGDYTEYKLLFGYPSNITINPSLVIGKEYWFSDDNESWELGDLHDHAEGSFQSKAGSKTEWYDHIKDVKPVTVPVYTQEMADECVSPSVGMMCNFAIVGGLWQDVFVDYISEVVIVVTDGKGAQAAFLIEDSRFNPVTPPIELIDGKAYQFDYNNEQREGFYDKSGVGAFIFIRGWCGTDSASNIKPLTFEVTK